MPTRELGVGGPPMTATVIPMTPTVRRVPRQPARPVKPGVDEAAVSLLHRLADLPEQAPDRAAVRARAIEAWLPLARHLAQRVHGRGEPLDDLVQIATGGLIKAIDRFDPEYGNGWAARPPSPTSPATCNAARKTSSRAWKAPAPTAPSRCRPWSAPALTAPNWATCSARTTPTWPWPNSAPPWAPPWTR